MKYPKITDEQFAQIKTDFKVRNAVAFAHGLSGSDFKIAMLPSGRVLVSAGQIAIASKQREEDKKKLLAEYEKSGVLVFTGMGMSYPSRYEGDPCNHRIRAEFMNDKGHRYFLEVGTGRGDEMRVDHAVDRDMEHSYDDARAKLHNRMKAATDANNYKLRNEIMTELRDNQKQPYYNFKDLERSYNAKYTTRNILNLVNQKFNASFTEMVVDEHTVRTEDIISKPNDRI